MCNRAVAKEVLRWMEKGKVWALGLGTPCQIWSQSRQPAAGDAQSSGMACARATLRFLRACRKHGIFIVLENPLRSRLWSWPPLRRELRRCGCYFVDFDMCAFSTAWKKPTRIATNLPDCQWLAMQCPGHSRHVILQGKVHSKKDGDRWRTSYAAAYPPRLVRAWARALCGSAPRHSWRQANEPRLWPWWEQRQASVSGAMTPQRCLAAPRLQPERLGWEGADRHWNGLDLKTELSILQEVQNFNRQEAKTSAARKASW